MRARFDDETARAVMAEMDAMNEALTDGRPAVDALAAILGLEVSPELAAAMITCMKAAENLAAHNHGPGGPRRYWLATGFSQGLGLATAVLRVRERRLQPVVNRVWDLAHEFEMSPESVLAAVCEWLEPVVTDG